MEKKNKQTLKRASVVNTPHYEKYKNENKVPYVCLHLTAQRNINYISRTILQQ